MIIEIDGGRFEELEPVKRSVLRQGVQHLVLWDEDGRNHRRYGVASWPFAYLIGRDGTVLWKGRPTKAVLSDDGEQKVVDRQTGRRMRDLVVQALEKSPRDEVARKWKETIR